MSEAAGAGGGEGEERGGVKEPLTLLSQASASLQETAPSPLSPPSAVVTAALKAPPRHYTCLH
jgi:hypothetical protein